MTFELHLYTWGRVEWPYNHQSFPIIPCWYLYCWCQFIPSKWNWVWEKDYKCNLNLNLNSKICILLRFMSRMGFGCFHNGRSQKLTSDPLHFTLLFKAIIREIIKIINLICPLINEFILGNPIEFPSKIVMKFWIFYQIIYINIQTCPCHLVVRILHSNSYSTSSKSLESGSQSWYSLKIFKGYVFSIKSSYVPVILIIGAILYFFRVNFDPLDGSTSCDFSRNFGSYSILNVPSIVFPLRSKAYV